MPAAPVKARTGWDRWYLASLIALAFILRVSIRLLDGEDAYFAGGYFKVYAEIAKTFLAGGGLCYEPGVGCAVREPVYSLLVAPFVGGGRLFPCLPVLQAAVGASLVWLTWALALELCGLPTARIAAALAAVSPYALMHDTAFQETVIINTLIALALYALLRTARAATTWAPVWSGVMLALAVLTTARVALIVPFALAWVAWRSAPTLGERARRVLVVLVPVVVLVGGWTVRNWMVVGQPVLTTEAGESLWAANNAWTFEFLPDQSIDLAVSASYDRMSAEERLALGPVERQEVARDRLLEQWGWNYMKAHPGRVLGNATRKVWSPLSGTLSPSRGSRLDGMYAAFFVPVHLLGLVGLWRARHGSLGTSLVYLVLVAFALTTAVFWAHTSHKSYLDALIFVYAASALESVRVRSHLS